MAKILIVDDREENRDFLVTLLGYQGHTLWQASDGLEALDKVRTETPDLVISDVLMPTMDGYEFVRRLRSDANLAATPVIFCTAHYLEREAKVLAETSGVKYMLRKPCEPQEVLDVVAAALGSGIVPVPPTRTLEQLGDQHLRLLTDRVSENAKELRFASLRLSALLEICRKLGYERDPKRLVERYARAAREIVGAGQAGIRIGGESGREQIATSGLDEVAAKSLSWGKTGAPAEASLTVPICTPSRTYGWLWLTDKLGGGDFVGDDASVAMALAGQLAVAYENVSLYEEFQRRSHEMEERLRLKKAKLNEANACRATMVQAVSHELRSPIGRAGALMDLLMKRPGALSADSTETAGQVLRELRLMSALLSELETLSHAEADKITLSQVNLRELVDETIGNLRQANEARSIEWRIGKLPVLAAYRGLLKQVLMNLLGNAVKFSAGRQRAIIEVGEVLDRGRRAIYVRDNGAGFEPAKADRLFGVFERLHSSAEFPGTGLGLAITKTIVERHGGEIWAESDFGKSATFWFTLSAGHTSEASRPVHRQRGAADNVKGA